MLKIIEVMLVLILVRNQILGQVNDIEVDINVAVKHNWIPKIYQKSFIERANLYLESIKIHNNNEISNLLGTHFNCRGKRVVYSMEQKDLLVNKINETQLIDYKILNIGYSTENFGLPFQKRKWQLICRIKELVNNQVVEDTFYFFAYRQDNQWYFFPEGVGATVGCK